MVARTNENSQEVIEGEVIEGRALAKPTQSTYLESQTRGEIDIQIRTAKAYPRSIDTFKKNALAMATLDEEIAGACMYALLRGGKSIEGPSVRLAEIMASAWGHLRVEARVVANNGKFITARAVAWDLENNVAIAIENQRRCTDKSGRSYNEDMMVVTGNAACAIALRNAVFKVVPNAFTKEIYEAARKVAVGDQKTLAARRVASLEYFAKLGVRPEQVFKTLGVRGEPDIGLDQLATLKGLATAIKEGDTTIEEAFAEEHAMPQRGSINMAAMRPGKVETHTEPSEPITGTPVPKTVSPAAPVSPPVEKPAVSETPKPEAPKAEAAPAATETDKPKRRPRGYVRKGESGPFTPLPDAPEQAAAPASTETPKPVAQPEKETEKEVQQPQPAAPQKWEGDLEKVIHMQGSGGNLVRYKIIAKEPGLAFKTRDAGEAANTMKEQALAAIAELKKVSIAYRDEPGGMMIYSLEVLAE